MKNQLSKFTILSVGVLIMLLSSTCALKLKSTASITAQNSTYEGNNAANQPQDANKGGNNPKPADDKGTGANQENKGNNPQPDANKPKEGEKPSEGANKAHEEDSSCF